MSTIPTPPETTLSEPSDTEIDGEMPPPRPIYLIVATALKPAMGIGLKGELPWPALKKDMAFFRRVTSDVPIVASGREWRNAVIMGRKTWESIPEKFRPLKGRINVVVTRNVQAFPAADGKDVLAVGGLREGLDVLDASVEYLSKVFVIGGSQIYEEAMKLRDDAKRRVSLRILQTLVRRSDGNEIECDTFFPLRLDETAERDGWRQVLEEEVNGWVEGKTVPGNAQWHPDGDGKMEIRVVGWEKSA